MSKSTAIIGAGVGGLAAIKCCLDEGLNPVCFETRRDLGGLWNYTSDVVRNRSSVWKSTITNVFKEGYCYSTFPIPDSFPIYMPHVKVLEYAKMYADKFALEKYIHYETEVVSVEQCKDFVETGRWNVTTRCCKTGKKSTDTFDHVMVCTGHHQYSYTPYFEGQNEFEGLQIHTQDYRIPDNFRDKKVLLIGFSNSSTDIACELSKVCSQVYISTRSGGWTFGRLSVGGLPVDLYHSQRFLSLLMPYFPAALRNFILISIVQSRHDHRLLGIEPKHNFESQIPVVSDELPACLLSGRIKFKDDVLKLTNHGAIFKDGTTENDIDVIIYGTGYEPQFPFLKHPSYAVENHSTNLYKYVFAPDVEPPTLAIVGCVEATGSMLAVNEIHSRWACRVFKGSQKLPSKKQMIDEIKTRKEKLKKSMINTLRYGLCHDWIAHMDQVAEEIGCRPSIWRLWLADPVLAWHLLFGPVTPFQYRLTGPGEWRQARQTILDTRKRLEVPGRTRTMTLGTWRRVGWMIFFVKMLLYMAVIIFLFK